MQIWQLGTHSGSFHGGGSVVKRMLMPVWQAALPQSVADILWGCVADLCLRSTGTWNACFSSAHKWPTLFPWIHGWLATSATDFMTWPAQWTLQSGHAQPGRGCGQKAACHTGGWPAKIYSMAACGCRICFGVTLMRLFSTWRYLSNSPNHCLTIEIWKRCFAKHHECSHTNHTNHTNQSLPLTSLSHVP